MNRFALFKTLILATVFLLYCYNLFSQTISPLATFGIRLRYKNTVNNNHEQLGNIKHFRFLINSQVCERCSDDFLLIITVFSALGNYKRRNAIRKSWGEQFECTKTVFLTGITENKLINDKIIIESALYGDIVQGNFIDSYRNLTYKHVMDLKWVSKYCAKAKYIIKADDDVSLVTLELRDKLKLNPWGSRGVMACDPVNSPSVIRKDSKWAVPKQEFADDKYPVYCNGPIIIYSKDVIPRLLEESTKVPFFWIDDVYVTGILAKKIGVKPLKVGGYWLPFNGEAGIMDSHAEELNKSNTVDSYLMYKHWKSFWKIASTSRTFPASTSSRS